LSAVYIDTSAILAWLFGQRGADRVRETIDAHDLVTASVLTLLETERVLTRAETAGLVKASDAQKLRGLFRRESSAWMTMEISEEVRAIAGRPFPIEPVRTLDAVHLATALLFLRAYPDLEILALDGRIVANAAALGIAQPAALS
jgi:predicted nucleic acid-binding protein